MRSSCLSLSAHSHHDSGSLWLPEKTAAISSARSFGELRMEPRTRKRVFASSFSTSSSGSASVAAGTASSSATSSPPRLLQLVEIGHRRLPARGHDLRLEALGQHDADVVAQHVARLLLDQQRRLQHVALGRVLRLDDRQLLGRVVAEHVLEELVEARRVLHQPSAVRPS